jgi:hypothetical protein
MKTILLICLIILGGNYKLFGQDSIPCKDRNTQIIEYDFSKGEFLTKKIKPCQGVPTVLKINNINTYFYDIQITSNDVHINANKEIGSSNAATRIIKVDTTAILGILDTKSIKSLVVPLINLSDQKDKNKENEIKEKKKEIVNIRTKINDLKYEISELEEKISENQKLLNDYGINEQSIENKDSARKSINAIIKESDDSIKEKNFKIQKLNSQIQITESELNFKLRQVEDTQSILRLVNEDIESLNSKYFQLNNAFMDILKACGAYNNYLFKIFRPNLTSIEYLKIKYPNEKFETNAILNHENLHKYYTDIKRFTDLYSDFQTEYSRSVSRINFLFINADQNILNYQPFLQAEYDRIKNSAESMMTKVENMNLSAKLNAVEVYNRELQDPLIYTYVSDPIQGMGDFLEFEVTIQPKTVYKEVLSKTQSRNFKYSEYLRGGIRYDFSVGTVFDFINKDEEFENRDGVIKKISQNKYKPTLATMFHVSLRSSSNWSGGVSLGASLNVMDFDINSLFIGPSLLVGKKDKVIFTSGISFRNTKQLERGYKDGLSIDPRINIDDLMTSNFRLGVFFGISYNLTNKQKSEIKIAE